MDFVTKYTMLNNLRQYSMMGNSRIQPTLRYQTIVGHHFQHRLLQGADRLVDQIMRKGTERAVL